MEPATVARQFTPELEQMLSERMATGKYPSVDDLLCEALHALDEIHRRHAELREEIQRRLEHSGTGQPIDREAFKQEMHSQFSSLKD